MKILITGSNRGLGLEYVRQLSARGDQVFAACRLPDEAEELQQLAAQHPELITILKLDVTSQEDIDAAAKTVSEAVEGLDLLVNNAGVNKPGELGHMKQETMRHIFEINVYGPPLVIQAFAPLLAKGETPKVVNLSSGLGSIEWAEGRQPIYSASKAALNMFTRSLSFPLREQGITVIAMDPGWVQTRMGGAEAPLQPEESISGMLKVIDGLTLEDAGRYLRHDGEELPW